MPKSTFVEVPPEEHAQMLTALRCAGTAICWPCIFCCCVRRSYPNR